MGQTGPVEGGMTRHKYMRVYIDYCFYLLIKNANNYYSLFQSTIYWGFLFLKIRSLLSKGINDRFKSAASDSFENISYACWSVAETTLTQQFPELGKSLWVSNTTEG